MGSFSWAWAFYKRGGALSNHDMITVPSSLLFLNDPNKTLNIVFNSVRKKSPINLTFPTH